MEKKNKKNSTVPVDNEKGPIPNLKDLIAGLMYVSETDAPVEEFNGGRAENVSSETLVKLAGVAANRIEEIKPEEFFSRLTTIRAWYGSREKRISARWRQLEKRLDQDLRELSVFRIGRVQIEIFVVGLDRNGDLAGVKMRSVET